MALTMYSKYAFSLMRLKAWAFVTATFLIACLTIHVQAQSEESPVIHAGNIEQLAPVITVDFDDLPPLADEVLNGKVFVSADGRRLAVVNRSGQALILDDTGHLLDVTDAILTPDGIPATFIDGAFDPTGEVFAALHTAGSGYYVTLHGALDVTQTRLVESTDKPTAIWLDDEAVWLEVIPNESNDDPYILSLATDGLLANAELMKIPFAPAQDDAAVARVGRLPSPFAVTSTEAGVVSRWDLSAGTLTASAQVNAVPIYGALTPDGRYLAWRDPASAAFHLLDFESGEDRAVVPLNGTYVPFILLTIQADVIIGVDVNDEPVVVAWDTQSGERHNLGLYRQCGRPPDMVVLSGDGQSLVIGCDRGLEIWRIQE